MDLSYTSKALSMSSEEGCQVTSLNLFTLLLNVNKAIKQLHLERHKPNFSDPVQVEFCFCSESSI